KKQKSAPPPAKKKKEEKVLPAETIEQIEQSGNGFVVETKKDVRYVDTRTSTADLEKIETTERLERLVDDDMTKLEGGRNKKKKRVKNRERQPIQEPAEKKPQPKKKTIEFVEIPDEITVGELA